MNNEPRPGEPFAPEIVDEKIEQFLQVQDEQQQTDIHLVHELKSIYQGDADILARARTRLFQNESTITSVGTPHDRDKSKQNQSRADLQQRLMGHDITHEKQEARSEKNLLHHYRRYKHMKQETSQPEQAGTHRFALVAAVIFATFLVGSMAGLAYFTHRASSSQTSQIGTAHPTPQKRDQAKTSKPKSSKGMPGSIPGVYISTDHNVIRTDVQTGKIFWTYKVATSEIVSDRDTVYIRLESKSQNAKSAIVALDAQSGKVRWTHKFDAMLGDVVVSNGVVYGGVAFISGSANDKPSSIVYALNSADGAEQAKYQIGTGYVEQINISAGILYVTAGNSLSATNLSDGKQLWSITTNNTKEITSKPQVANGFVYIMIQDLTDTSGNGISVIVAFNANSGAKVWQSETAGHGTLMMSVTDTTIYVGTNDGIVAAYDALHGKHLWSYTTGVNGPLSLFVADGVVYASVNATIDNSFNGSEEIIAVDASTGQERWHTSVKSGAIAMIVASNGFVYVTSDTGPASSVLYALKTTGGSQIWNTSIVDTIVAISVTP
jgi:outer membrane protein assembly factor BamB